MFTSRNDGSQQIIGSLILSFSVYDSNKLLYQVKRVVNLIEISSELKSRKSKGMSADKTLAEGTRGTAEDEGEGGQKSKWKKELDRVFTIPSHVAFHYTPEQTGEYTEQLTIPNLEDATEDCFDPCFEGGQRTLRFFGVTSRKEEGKKPSTKPINERKKKVKEGKGAPGAAGGGEVDGERSKLVEKKGSNTTKIHEFYRISKERDKPRDKEALYIKDNGIDDHEMDAAGYDKSSLDPQLKLQSYFRKAFEYRMINALEATELKVYSDILTALTLILASVISVLLLAGDSSEAVDAAGILSALISLITGYLSYMGFNERLERHNQSVAAFASVQRDIYTVLMIENDKGISDELAKLTAAFNEARLNMPLIPAHKVTKYRDEQDRSLFPDITDESLWNDSLEVVRDVSEMRLDVRRKSIGPRRQLQFETAKTSKRNYQRMMELQLRPLRRIVDK